MWSSTPRSPAAILPWSCAGSNRWAADRRRVWSRGSSGTRIFRAGYQPWAQRQIPRERQPESGAERITGPVANGNRQGRRDRRHGVGGTAGGCGPGQHAVGCATHVRRRRETQERHARPAGGSVVETADGRGGPQPARRTGRTRGHPRAGGRRQRAGKDRQAAGVLSHRLGQGAGNRDAGEGARMRRDHFRQRTDSRPAAQVGGTQRHGGHRPGGGHPGHFQRPRADAGSAAAGGTRAHGVFAAASGAVVGASQPPAGRRAGRQGRGRKPARNRPPAHA